MTSKIFKAITSGRVGLGAVGAVGAVWCCCLVLGMTWPNMVSAAGREQPEQTVKKESIMEGVKTVRGR